MAKKPRSMDDRVWQRFKEKLEAAKGARVKIGVLANVKGNAKVEGAQGDFDMVALAATHEFGAPARPWNGFVGIPARPFISATFEQNRDAAKKKISQLAVAFLKGRISLHRGLEILGAWGVGEVQSYMNSGKITPKLSPVTIAKKGSNKPLIDHGRLKQSITYKVEGGGTAGRAGWRK